MAPARGDSSAGCSSAAAAQAWRTEAGEVCKVGQVVLVDPRHVLHPCFPLDLFPTVVEYAGPASGGPAAAAAEGGSGAVPASAAPHPRQQQQQQVAAVEAAPGLLAAAGCLGGWCKQYVVISSKPSTEADLATPLKQAPPPAAAGASAQRPAAVTAGGAAQDMAPGGWTYHGTACIACCTSAPASEAMMLSKCNRRIVD
jgi:hypothetical protein